MQRRILYFINPISGTKSKAPLLALIAQETNRSQIPFEISDTRKDGDYAYLPGKIAKEKITDVVVCGGDGTVSQVAAWLLDTQVNIGIIPMGSGNGLALAAGISKDPKLALAIVFKGKTAMVDGFTINNHFSCMLCGLGLDAQVAKDFAGQSRRGLLTYVKETIRHFFSAPDHSFVLHSGGKRISTEALFVSIANSNQFGNHVTIAPKASLNDGLLDIVVAGKSNRLLLVYRLLRQIRLGRVERFDSTKAQKSTVFYFQTDHLVIENPEMAPLHIDGDPAETADRFTINIVPNAFRLLQP